MEKGGEGDSVLVDGGSVENRHEVERDNTPFSKLMENLVDVGNGGLSKEAESVELRVVHRILDAFRFSWGSLARSWGTAKSRGLDVAGGQMSAEYIWCQRLWR